METILTRAQAAGASEAGYILLRLPLETQDLFSAWLLENFPDKYRKVLALLRSTREGKLYDSTWGKRMTGTGPYAWTLGRRFELACERLGLERPQGEAAHRPFYASAGGRGSAEPVLIRRPTKWLPVRVKKTRHTESWIMFGERRVRRT